MKNTAKVISVEDKIATVSVVRSSACEGCKQRSYCSQNSCVEEVVTSAINEVGASVGDTVEIESDSKGILGISFCVFVLPVLLCFAAYFITAYFTSNSAICYAVCFCTLFFAALIFALVFNKVLSRRLSVTITKIIERN